MYLLYTGIHGNRSICGDAASRPTHYSVINKLTACNGSVIAFGQKSKVIMVSREYQRLWENNTLYSSRDMICVRLRPQNFVYRRVVVSPRIQKNSADLRLQADESAVRTQISVALGRCSVQRKGHTPFQWRNHAGTMRCGANCAQRPPRSTVVRLSTFHGSYSAKSCRFTQPQ